MVLSQVSLSLSLSLDCCLYQVYLVQVFLWSWSVSLWSVRSWSLSVPGLPGGRLGGGGLRGPGVMWDQAVVGSRHCAAVCWVSLGTVCCVLLSLLPRLSQVRGEEGEELFSRRIFLFFFPSPPFLFFFSKQAIWSLMVLQ